MKLGVIGLGYWGPNLARNISATPGVELAALCDVDGAQLEMQSQLYPGVRAATSATEILEDPSIEAVAIATPITTLFGLAKQALLADKHVLVEKPMAAAVHEAEELVALAAQRDRVLMVDHPYVHSPAVQKLAELNREGELGKLLFIDSVRINLGLVRGDVNVIWDLAPHDLSIFNFILGRGPRSVLAAAGPATDSRHSAMAHLHLDFGDGLIASVHVNWLSPVKIRHLLIGGSRRSALYNDLDNSEPVKLYDRGVDILESPEDRRRRLVSYRAGDVVSPKIPKAEPLRNLIEHFAFCIETHSIPISDGQSGVKVVQVLEAADRSIEKGGVFVEIPDA